MSVRVEAAGRLFSRGPSWGAPTPQKKQGPGGAGADVEEALNAAAQIGDENLGKRKSWGTVVPRKRSFTHGSSPQRLSWFRRGLTRAPPSVQIPSKGRLWTVGAVIRTPDGSAWATSAARPRGCGACAPRLQRPDRPRGGSRLRRAPALGTSATRGRAFAKRHAAAVANDLSSRGKAAWSRTTPSVRSDPGDDHANLAELRHSRRTGLNRAGICGCFTSSRAPTPYSGGRPRLRALLDMTESARGAWVSDLASRKGTSLRLSDRISRLPLNLSICSG